MHTTNSILGGPIFNPTTYKAILTEHTGGLDHIFRRNVAECDANDGNYNAQAFTTTIRDLCFEHSLVGSIDVGDTRSIIYIK